MFSVTLQKPSTIYWIFLATSYPSIQNVRDTASLPWGWAFMSRQHPRMRRPRGPPRGPPHLAMRASSASRSSPGHAASLAAAAMPPSLPPPVPLSFVPSQYCSRVLLHTLSLFATRSRTRCWRRGQLAWVCPWRPWRRCWASSPRCWSSRPPPSRSGLRDAVSSVLCLLCCV
jgi:hypothetical protein